MPHGGHTKGGRDKSAESGRDAGSLSGGGMKNALEAKALCRVVKYSAVFVGEEPASIFTLGTDISAGSVAKLAFSLILGVATSSPSLLAGLEAASSAVASWDFSEVRFVGEAFASSVVIASASAAHSSSSPANRTQNVNATPDTIAEE